MFKQISDKVQKIIADSETGKIEFGGNKNQAPFQYNQREIIRKINFYINNKYTERDDDAIFWNIGNPRVTHFAKFISPDTKDFMPYGLGEHNFWQAWALRKKVKNWFKDNSFYMTLNDVAEGLSTYGSMVWKKRKVNGKYVLEECKLENLYFNQRVKNIADTDVVEMHYLSQGELYERADVYNGVDAIVKKEGDNDCIAIWEYSGYYIDEKTMKPKYAHCVGYGSGDDAVELWNEEGAKKENFPYYDFHLGRYRGRWLRIGVIERLFALQERANQLVNQNAQTTEIASLLLLKSANADISGNVLEQAVNGQIIGDETLQQIGITNTGLNQFISEMQLIENQADKLCLTPEIVQGESSPSNTTFRGISVVSAGAISAFRNYKQNLFEKIADILLKDIFPSLCKEWNREDAIEMAEDDEDIEAYDKAVSMYMQKEAMLNGELVTPETVSSIEEQVAERAPVVGRKIEIGKDFFNFKWGFKMVPTDETIDKASMNDTYFNALQMTGANPAITTVPGFKQYLEDNGISPWKLTPKQIEELKQGSGNFGEMRKPDQLLAQAGKI